MLLLDKHCAPAKGSNSGEKPLKFASRWKLIISSYNNNLILNTSKLIEISLRRGCCTSNNRILLPVTFANAELL